MQTESRILESVLGRHYAFWHRLPVERPLLTVTEWHDYSFYEPFPLIGGTVADSRTLLNPGMVDARAYLKRAQPSDVIDGDFLRPWTAYDACWMEAMLGCVPVAESGTTWAEPVITGWNQIDGIIQKGGSGWLDEFLAVHRVLASMAHNQPIGQPLMRGPMDMALAALGSEMFSEGFYERPQELRALLEHCTEIRLKATHLRLEVIPDFQGGYCGRDVWGLWAPGRLLDIQEDAAGLLSPQMYRDFAAPLDRRMIQQFDYSLMHLHSGQLQMLSEMLNIPELTAVQIAIDPPPYGPSAGALLPQFRSIQQAGKALLLTGPVTQIELDQIVGELSPVGLALRLGLMSDDSVVH
jgi:hypothetical protein